MHKRCEPGLGLIVVDDMHSIEHRCWLLSVDMRVDEQVQTYLTYSTYVGR